MDDGGSLIEEALLILEDEQAWPALSSALITRAVYLVLSHRPEEGYAVLHHALAMAERHDLPQVALRARFNLAGIWIEHSRLGEALEELREGLLLARERGDRMWELQLYGQQVAPLVVLGRWDDAAALADALLAGDVTTDSLSGAAFLAPLAAARGEEELLARCVAMAERPREDALDQRAAASVVFGLVALHRGEYDEAQRLVEAQTKSQSSTAELVEQAYALSVEAAIAAGDEATMIARRAAIDELRPARATPLLRASRARLAAELAHLAGEHEAVAKFEDEAESLLRQVEARPRLASALLERARRGERPEALAEGRAILVSLGAVRWLKRVDHQFHVVA